MFGPSWVHGRPRLGPIIAGAQVWALMGPWGAQISAHHRRGSSLGHGGPKVEPIIGGAHCWALMGPWEAQA
jgi:hypothetical protein